MIWNYIALPIYVLYMSSPQSYINNTVFELAKAFCLGAVLILPAMQMVWIVACLWAEKVKVMAITTQLSGAAVYTSFIFSLCCIDFAATSLVLAKWFTSMLLGVYIYCAGWLTLEFRLRHRWGIRFDARRDKPRQYVLQLGFSAIFFAASVTAFIFKRQDTPPGYNNVVAKNMSMSWGVPLVVPLVSMIVRGAFLAAENKLGRDNTPLRICRRFVHVVFHLGVPVACFFFYLRRLKEKEYMDAHYFPLPNGLSLIFAPFAVLSLISTVWCSWNMLRLSCRPRGVQGRGLAPADQIDRIS